MELELKPIALEETHTHLALVGRLDLLGAGAVENKFLGYAAARKKTCLVDLSGLAYLGSMGMRVFVSAAKALGNEGKRLILFGAQPSVDKALRVAGFEHIVDLAPDEASARAKAGL